MLFLKATFGTNYLTIFIIKSMVNIIIGPSGQHEMSMTK